MGLAAVTVIAAFAVTLGTAVPGSMGGTGPDVATVAPPPTRSVAADDAGNGVLMMVHGHFSPGPNEVSPVFVPPGQEAVASTSTDGVFRLFVIPYDVASVLPIVVTEPTLVIKPVGPGTGLTLAPADTDPAEHRICNEETQLPGHEGPVEACIVFELAADAFADTPVVTMALWFHDAHDQRQVEHYNAVEHYALHANIENGGTFPSLSDVDANSQGHETPFVLVDLPAG